MSLTAGRKTTAGSVPALARCLAAMACTQALCAAAQDAPAITPKIIGGKDVSIAENPWQVSLADSPAAGHHCGGVLVHPEWVLTAAHCVTPATARQMVVRGGSDRLDGRMATVRVRAAVVHEDYDHPPYHHDIALLRVEAFDAGSGVRPIGGTVPGSLLGRMLPFMPVRVTGWGVSRPGVHQTASQLQGAELPVVPNTRCRQAPAYAAVVTDAMLCLGTDGGDTVTCNGDSGGPASVNFNGHWVLVGLTSFGLKQCVGGYAVFTRVAAYADWVLRRTDGQVDWR